MGVETHYTFFDRAIMDPVWDMTWADFLAAYPRVRRQITELVEFVFNSTTKAELGEDTDEQVRRILATKTIRWTVRRSTPQFFMMGEIMYYVPSLRRHMALLSTGFNEDVFALIAGAVDRFVQGETDRTTLRAVMKLHNVERPGDWLDLPKKVSSRVDGLVPPAQLTKPLYRWQGREACEYSTMGNVPLDVHNCLDAADTGRFLSFLEEAWKQDRPVPYLTLNDRTHYMSAGPAAGAAPSFRQFDIARRLIPLAKKVRRFKRAVMFRDVT